MKSKYGRHFTTSTPQYQRIPEADQIRNRAGGWAFPVTDEIQLERFLILGTSENTYYADARELTREAALCIERLLEEGKGVWVVGFITGISTSGRAPKNDPAIFALAMCLKTGDTETRRAAAEAAPHVCRTATHLAQFAEVVKMFSKVTITDKYTEHYAWSRVVKRAFTNWLDSKTNDQLAYQMIKYRQREGWTLRDMLRRAKPKPGENRGRSLLYGWATGKNGPMENIDHRIPEIISAYEAAQKATIASELVKLIQGHRLPWEAIPSQWARNLDVQAALLETMPPTATIRQLGRLTSIGLLQPGSGATGTVVNRLRNAELLKRARVHPMDLYLASEVYGAGQGMRSKLTWTPVREVHDALGEAYFKSFGNVEPTGKNIVVGVDTSQSMNHGGIMGVPAWRCVEAAFISAYTLMRIEPNVRGVLFDGTSTNFSMRHVESLAELQREGRRLFRSGGDTNCALPMLHAMQEQWHDVDAFVIFTDNETWRGHPHPIEALWHYRKLWGRRTKLLSQAFVANGYSVQPADDAESLAMIGMDQNAPAIITNFLRN